LVGNRALSHEEQNVTAPRSAAEAKAASGTSPVPEIDLRREPITSPSAAALFRALNAELSERYPEPGANHFRIDADEVAEGRGAFVVAYAGGGPVGCGAIRRLDGETAEVKRMYVEPAARGQGVGRLVLAALEEEARRLGVRSLVLETGERQPESLRLYSGAGFVRIPPFGEYEASPLSVCMEKRIDERAPDR